LTYLSSGYIVHYMSFVRRVKRGDKVYLAEVRSKRIGKKVVQEHIRYIGREADGKTILSSSVSDVSIESVKVYGPLLVLNGIAREIELSSMLGAFGDEILSLVYAHCLDYKSVNQMPSWFERTDLNVLLDLEGLTEDRLLRALDSLESQDSTLLQRRIFEKVKQVYALNDKGIVYDVTNTYFYGKKCPLGKYGKDKEGVKGRPLIQIALGVTKLKGVPVVHKVYEGNVHDSRTLRDMLTDLRQFDFKEGYIVFDRGISSGKNQDEIKDLEWKVICGLPLNSTLKRFLSPFVAKNGFLDYKNRIRLKKTVFYAIVRRFTLAGIPGKLVMCFNEQQRKDLRESRYDEISHARKLLQKGKRIKQGLEIFFDSEGNMIPKKLRQAEKFDGYSVIFTTARLPREQIVKIYFDKDLVEKAFQSLKGVIKLQPIRHWLYNRVISHVFVCYLSYLLLTLLRIKLEPLDLSPVKALRELETMYKIYMFDANKGLKISKVVTLTKKQEKVLKAIDKRLLDEVDDRLQPEK